MSEDLDEKIKSLVREADDLFGMYDADRVYKRHLNEMLFQIGECDLRRSLANLERISVGISWELEDYEIAREELGEDRSHKDEMKEHGVRGLKKETVQAFKFLLNEKCGCKLR